MSRSAQLMDRSQIAQERRHGFALGVTFACFVLVAALVPKLPDDPPAAAGPAAAPTLPPALPPWLLRVLREVKVSARGEFNTMTMHAAWECVPQDVKLAAGYVL